MDQINVDDKENAQIIFEPVFHPADGQYRFRGNRKGLTDLANAITEATIHGRVQGLGSLFLSTGDLYIHEIVLDENIKNQKKEVTLKTKNISFLYLGILLLLVFIYVLYDSFT